MSTISVKDGPPISAADLDLLASVRQGVSGALETLAERYGLRIYRNRADAQEVLQDVLLTLVRKDLTQALA